MWREAEPAGWGQRAYQVTAGCRRKPWVRGPVALQGPACTDLASLSYLHTPQCRVLLSSREETGPQPSCHDSGFSSMCYWCPDNRCRDSEVARGLTARSQLGPCHSPGPLPFDWHLSLLPPASLVPWGGGAQPHCLLLWALSPSRPPGQDRHSLTRGQGIMGVALVCDRALMEDSGSSQGGRS